MISREPVRFTYLGQRQQGIALMQVLLISLILTVFSLYFSLSSRQQVAIAQLADDKALAYLHLLSAENQLKLQLVTRDWNRRGGVEGLPQQYNLFGEPFVINDHVEVTLQDTSGLLGIRYPDQDTLKNLIIQKGYDSIVAYRFVDSLIHWQDSQNTHTQPRYALSPDQYPLPPRRQIVSFSQELKQIGGIDPALGEYLSRWLLANKVNYFNPLLAPEPVLSAYLGYAADELVALRKTHRLSSREFSRLTAIYEQEGRLFTPSQQVKIDLIARYGEVELHKEMQLHFFPYAQRYDSPIHHLYTLWSP